MMFPAKKQPILKEEVKLYGMTPIRKAVAQCEIDGEKSESCKKAWKDLGIDLVVE